MSSYAASCLHQLQQQAQFSDSCLAAPSAPPLVRSCGAALLLGRQSFLAVVSIRKRCSASSFTAVPMRPISQCVPFCTETLCLDEYRMVWIIRSWSAKTRRCGPSSLFVPDSVGPVLQQRVCGSQKSSDVKSRQMSIVYANAPVHRENTLAIASSSLEIPSQIKGEP